MYRVGLSCGAEGKLLTKDTFESCRAVGIDAMEISVLKEAIKDIDYKNVKPIHEKQNSLVNIY